MSHTGPNCSWLLLTGTVWNGPSRQQTNQEEEPVARSYEEVSAERRLTLPEAAQHQAEVFAGAYDLAVQLITLRERRGMTQSELAAATGIDQGDVSRIERGSANPTEKTLLRIADALGADLRFVEREAS